MFPINETVPVPGVKAPPLLVQFPETVKIYEPENVSDAPELIVRLLQTAEALITGWFPPELIITFVEAVGTTPSHQLFAVFQSVLINPVQEPAVHDLAATFNLPVAVAKLLVLTKVAPEPVPPHVPAGSPIPPRDSVPTGCVNEEPKFATDTALIISAVTARLAKLDY